MADVTHGMDVAAVREISRKLATQAAALQSVSTDIDALVTRSSQAWKGWDSDQFGNKWRGSIRGGVQDLCNRLEELARTASANADAQEHASGWLEGGGAWSNGGPLDFSAAEQVDATGMSVGSIAFTLDAIQLAAASYDQGHPVPGGWYELQASDLMLLGLDPSDLHDSVTGFDATLYRNRDGQIVVAFRGTDKLIDWSTVPASFGDQGANPDVYNDVQAMKGWAPQDENAARLALKLRDGVQSRGGNPDDVFYVGHSLGGRNAMIASLVTGNHATAINSLNVSAEAYWHALSLRVDDAGSGGIEMLSDSKDFVSMQVTPNGLPGGSYQRVVLDDPHAEVVARENSFLIGVSPAVGAAKQFVDEKYRGHDWPSVDRGYRAAIEQMGSGDLVKEADQLRGQAAARSKALRDEMAEDGLYEVAEGIYAPRF